MVFPWALPPGDYRPGAAARQPPLPYTQRATESVGRAPQVAAAMPKATTVVSSSMMILKVRQHPPVPDIGAPIGS
jgi:hypothetical protein